MPARRQFALAKQRKLLKGVKEIAIEKGAVPTPDGFYQFQLQTCVGLLRLSMSEGHSLTSVCCRFEEPERAVELIGRNNMNHYSGKWNHHWGKEDDPEIALRLFKADLERLHCQHSRHRFHAEGEHMKAKEGTVMFVVVPSTSRKYGYSIQAPADVTWAKGPGNMFGWYRRKRDAQRRCDELNRGTAVDLGQMEAMRNRHV